MSIRPFSNGSEFECWMHTNCYRCEKYYVVDISGYSTCEIENAIADATATGVVSEEIAARMGIKNPGGNKCTEFVQISKWHIVGNVNDRSVVLTGPFNSKEDAVLGLTEAPLLINEIKEHLKSPLDNVKLFVMQTNDNSPGQINNFIDMLTEQQIKGAFSWTNTHNPMHLHTIKCRGSGKPLGGCALPPVKVTHPEGSQWSHQGGNIIPWKTLAMLPWKKLHKYQYDERHSSECLYYYYEGEHPIGMQTVKLLSKFDDYSSIRLVDGAHGLELVSSEVSSTLTNKAWLILGPAQDSNGIKYPGQYMVWTAFPGELTGSLKKAPFYDGTFDSLVAAAKNGYPIAVKAG